MQTGRAAYDSAIKMTTIQADEPTFLLRGQDQLAAKTVRAWASFAHAAGAPLAVVESALQQADAMHAWPIKKLPDADHLAEHDQKQLAFQFSRRAWGAATDRYEAALGPPVMLAEERAYSKALGKLRPILRTLFERGEWRADGCFLYDPDAGPKRDGAEAPCAIKQLLAAAFILRQPGKIDDEPILPLINEALKAGLRELQAVPGDTTTDGRAEAIGALSTILFQLKGAA